MPLRDLLAQSPLWAPETVEPVSAGFNHWMDTLPFGESSRHKHLRENWERRHAEAQRSQTQMLRMQELSPNIWTDYTMGGDGVKCVCDAAAAGDPEMEGMSPPMPHTLANSLTHTQIGNPVSKHATKACSMQYRSKAAMRQGATLESC